MLPDGDRPSSQTPLLACITCGWNSRMSLDGTPNRLLITGQLVRTRYHTVVQNVFKTSSLTTIRCRQQQRCPVSRVAGNMGLWVNMYATADRYGSAKEFLSGSTTQALHTSQSTKSISQWRRSMFLTIVIYEVEPLPLEGVPQRNAC